MGKTKRDPNAPKRPSTSFILFSNDKRKEVKEENPEFTIGETGKRLGELWKELTDKAKKVYVDQAEEKREQYKKDLEEYNANKSSSDEDSDDDDAPKKKKKKQKKDPNAPKRPLSAYFCFAGEKRAEVKEDNPDMVAKEIVSELGRLWNELNEDEKEPYKQLNEKEKKRYEKEMAAYKK